MTKKICNDKTGSDKKLHVFCEFVIAAFIGVLVSFIHFPSAIIAAVIAFAVAFAFGIYKEVKDSKQIISACGIWHGILSVALWVPSLFSLPTTTHGMTSPATSSNKP